MSRSNPKVLFTFQFGSRIVPLLSEQDLRKSLVSIAFLGQPITFNLLSLSLPASLCSHLLFWLQMGCWETQAFLKAHLAYLDVA